MGSATVLTGDESVRELMKQHTRRIALDLECVRSNLARIRGELAAAPRPDGGAPPIIVVVTKYLSASDSGRLRAAGIGPLGENRAGELAGKVELDADRAGWHFIGHLQRNKIGQIVPRVGLLHSLDSRRLARELGRWLATRDRSLFSCLVQVNVAGEQTKGGLDPVSAAEEIPTWIAEFPHLEIRGLMAMAPLVEAEACRPIFRQLRELRDRLRDRLPVEAGERFVELSMGMSNDFEVAVEEGATEVRIGSALFN